MTSWRSPEFSIFVSVIILAIALVSACQKSSTTNQSGHTTPYVSIDYRVTAEAKFEGVTRENLVASGPGKVTVQPNLKLITKGKLASFNMTWTISGTPPDYWAVQFYTDSNGAPGGGFIYEDVRYLTDAAGQGYTSAPLSLDRSYQFVITANMQGGTITIATVTVSLRAGGVQ